jgi:hypothetical protein
MALCEKQGWGGQARGLTFRAARASTIAQLKLRGLPSYLLSTIASIYPCIYPCAMGMAHGHPTTQTTNERHRCMFPIIVHSNYICQPFSLSVTTA